MNAANDEDIVLQFDVTHSFGYEPLIGCIDFTRLQRAPEGSGKSTGGGGDNIIQSGGVRFQDLGRNLIMLGHRAMHAENDRLGFSGEPGSANRSFDAFDSNFGTIDDG
jgi:hypothetical protein